MFSPISIPNARRLGIVYELKRHSNHKNAKVHLEAAEERIQWLLRFEPLTAEECKTVRKAQKAWRTKQYDPSCSDILETVAPYDSKRARWHQLAELVCDLELLGWKL